MKLKRNEYLQVVGLLALSKTHVAALGDIEKAICAIVGEKPNGLGHVVDAVYSGYDADTLIEKVTARNKIDSKTKK